MTSTINVGTRSSAVTQMQQQLAKLGYYKAKVDGAYGPVTKQAVSAFEKKSKLKADGIADGATRDALAKAVTPAKASIKQGMSGPAVKTLQAQLKQLGFYKSTVDGSFGPVTKAAVQAFERKHGWTADGIAGAEVQAKIASEAKKLSTPATPAKASIKQGMSGPVVSTLQTQLKQLGFYKSTVDGSFGPVTKAAVQAFERKHGWTADGIAGAEVQARIASEVKKLPTASWKTVGAPPADYRIVNFRGVRMNVRTRVMVERAESYMKQMGINSKLAFNQGSYNRGVSASAGTHDGGGALDIRIRGYSSTTADNIVKALRMAGFAGWRRGVNDSFPPHIHAIAIGDRQATRVASNQVGEYRRGGDGLVGSRRDIHLGSVGHNIGRPVPNWAA